MRRTLIGFLGGLSVLFGLVAVPHVADAARTTACTAGSLQPTHATEDDFAGYKANVTDPGAGPTFVGPVMTDPGRPPTYSGGQFDFSVKLDAASCAGATYTVYAFTDDNDTTFDGTGLSFTVNGNGSNPLSLTNGPQSIFAGYNNLCVLAHFTISVNGTQMYMSPQHQVCNGGGGRIW